MFPCQILLALILARQQDILGVFGPFHLLKVIIDVIISSTSDDRVESV